jgi:hypothetical protein
MLDTGLRDRGVGFGVHATYTLAVNASRMRCTVKSCQVKGLGV